MNSRTATSICSIVAFASLECVASAQPISITFDDVPRQTVITNQYPPATFSSDAGYVNITANDFDLGTSRPNYLCTAVGTDLRCANNTYVDFAVPVQNLRFFGGGDDGVGAVATVNVYSLGVAAGSVAVQGNGNFTDPFFVDLTSFANVTRIEIVAITDPGGVAWDDFTFDVQSWEVVPTSGSEDGGDRVGLVGPPSIAVGQPSVFFGSVAAMVISVAPGRINVATPPGTGVVDVTIVTSAWSFVVPHAYTYLDREWAARAGNVGVGAGEREAVLLVNASSGDALMHEVRIAPGQRIQLVMISPSSRPSARFVLFAWHRVPSAGTLTRLPRDVGTMVFPTHLTGGSPQPSVIWNNLGHGAILGRATASSRAAPSLILDAAQGSPNPARVTLQGIIEDDASGIPERVSVTNAVILRIE
ncbi:MAG: hypothetical protein HYR85_12250 [Planctomycetes bacterium]|nr:hypothetical protein [Planctomycetota bacterium]MBI3844388.1 hypothetical protein [Planctomycetota bacterium]